MIWFLKINKSFGKNHAVKFQKHTIHAFKIMKCFHNKLTSPGMNISYIIVIKWCGRKSYQNYESWQKKLLLQLEQRMSISQWIKKIKTFVCSTTKNYFSTYLNHPVLWLIWHEGTVITLLQGMYHNKKWTLDWANYNAP